MVLMQGACQNVHEGVRKRSEQGWEMSGKLKPCLELGPVQRGERRECQA